MVWQHKNIEVDLRPLDRGLPLGGDACILFNIENLVTRLKAKLETRGFRICGPEERPSHGTRNKNKLLVSRKPRSRTKIPGGHA